MQIINSVKKNIELIIKGEDQDNLKLLKFFLFVASFFYKQILYSRKILYKTGFLSAKKLSCFTISIGNLTAGGTGKTPMTIYLAKLISNMGLRVCVISRGYKRKNESNYLVVSDGEKILLEPHEAGDEPYLIAESLSKVPVIVGKDRFKAGSMAIKKFNPHVIILDDAFQHIKLKRDLDILLFDYQKPVGNGYVLPRGLLREPLSAIDRANVVIFTRSDKASLLQSEALNNYMETHYSVFKSVHQPYIKKIIKGTDSSFKNFNKDGALSLNNSSVFVFSGIADNSDFRYTIINSGCNIAGYMEYPDHYQYSDDDIDEILKRAGKKIDFIVTTEKDYVKIKKMVKPSINFAIMGVKISFDSFTKTFEKFIKNRIT